MNVCETMNLKQTIETQNNPKMANDLSNIVSTVHLGTIKG